jgi:allophanate hydrolase
MNVRLGVVGAHLRGQPLNAELLDLGAIFVQQTRTAPQYRLFVLSDTSLAKPGMIRSGNGGSIEIEIWELGATALGMLVASVPPPLVIGNVKLASGEWIKGFLCEEGSRPEGCAGNHERRRLARLLGFHLAPLHHAKPSAKASKD